jgi:hypothetical protein
MPGVVGVVSQSVSQLRWAQWVVSDDRAFSGAVLILELCFLGIVCAKL